MELNIKERLAMTTLLPQEGNMITLVLAKDIKNKIELTQELIKEVNFRVQGTSYVWDADKKVPDVEFTKEEIKLLQDRIELLEKEEKLQLENINLYVKIKDWKEKTE